METGDHVELTWVDLIKRSLVLDEIVQAIADYLPPDCGMTDNECLSAVIAIVEKRLGRPFLGSD